MSSALASYETGLSLLLKRLGQKHPRYTEALTLQSRLLENLAQARRYGDTETRRAERAEIIDRLNHLALETLGVSFNELAQEPGIVQGSGAIAQGTGSVSASDHSVAVGRDVYGSVVITGDGSAVGVDSRSQELEQARRIGDRTAEGTALANLAATYAAQGDSRRAAKAYEQAATIARELDDRKSEGIYLQELGLMRLRLGESSAAAETLEQALRLFESVEVDLLLRARTRYHLGRCYAKLGRWDEAVSVLEQARQTFTRHKTRPELAHTLLELGQLYGQMRDFESANIYLKDALRLFRRLGDTDGIAVTQEALGNLALQTARPAEAIEVLEKARQGYEALERRERVREVDELLGMARQAHRASERVGVRV
jgi:tetratricopeptide (TPR) repeat protein